MDLHMSRFTEKWCVPLLALAILLLVGANPVVGEVRTSSGVDMVLVPIGWMIMSDKQGEIDEKPPHKVWLQSFYIDKYEATQREYERVMGENPSPWKGATNSVDQVRWSDAVSYCNARFLDEGLQPCYDLETWECDFDANEYRLSTEAEWEYTGRAGTKERYFFGGNAAKLKLYVWGK